MSSIALFPCIFTPVAGVIGELSTSLELTIYNDDNLITDTSAKYDISPDKLKKIMYNRTSVFNQFTLEKESIINLFRSVITDRLNGPDKYLFYGFLTSLVPPEITHVLRTLVVDKKESRIMYATKEGVSQKEAKKNLRNHDISAYNWTDFLFQKEAYDSSLYDLVIPVGDKTHIELIEEIVKCYHTTSILHTKKSQKATQDMVLRGEVERLLLKNGHNMTVKADDGIVTLAIQNSVFNHGKLEKELTQLVQQVDDVRKVEVEETAKDTLSIYRKQKFELPSKVLFVDDEKEFVQTVSERLISRDVGTYGVYNGEDALDLISEDRPDVMVLDLKMPGLYGVEVLRRTKKVAPAVEVIILTGHGTKEDMQDCMELGAFAYLHKPVDIENLSETIKAANDKAHARAGK